MLSELESFKDQIPQFVIKLYHILEKSEYNDYISWAANDTQILIKQPKKLEDKVLPYFFRHKHLSSFIRQLNMYRFSKVNKISKERSWMYFKNDYFKRGQIKLMKFIKRTQANKKKDKVMYEVKKEQEELEVSREQSLIQQANNYRIETQKKFLEVQNILEGITKKNPFIFKEMSPAFQICEKMTGKKVPDIQQAYMMPSMGNIFAPNDNQQNQNDNGINKGMLGNTIRDFVPMQSLVMPSLCSLSHFEGI